MPIPLQGSNPYLQGNTQPLQGGSVANVLQPVVNPTAPPAPAPKPAPIPAPKPAIKPTVQPAVNPVQPAQPAAPQTFGFLNGSQYDINGNPVAAPTNTPANQPFITDPSRALADAAAQAGLSVDDYIKLATNGSGLSQQEKDKVYSDYGITDLEKQVFTPPSKTTEQLYTEAYNMAGLADLKKRIADLDTQINSKRQKLTDAQGVVNENPWLSEASRIGRTKRLNDQVQADIGNLVDQREQLRELYNTGIGEVNNLVTRSTTDFSNNQLLNTQKLAFLTDKAEKQITQKQTERANASLASLPAFLQAKAKAQKPDTIGTAETGYFRWNPTTGTFEQVIAPKTNTLEDAYKLLQIQKLQQEIAGGGNPNELLSVGDAQTLGVPYGTTKGQALSMGLTPQKPATDAQNQAAGYATRLDQAGKILDSLATDISGYGLVKFKAEQLAPNPLKSSTFQSYEQAARNFINAVLRRESGAAIAQSEFDNAYKQYLPYPGDSASTLAQKKANREAVLQGLVRSAGSAYGNTQAGVNPSDPLGLFNSVGKTSASTPYLKTLGPITGLNGSSLWQYGLDVDLKIGDPVKSPVSGTVIAAAPNGGFGNQVKIRTSDGKEIWLSHLQSGVVKVGQTVLAGQLIGYGGNTGNTIAGKGGDGSHLDITMKEASGKLLSAPQVKSFLDKIYV